MKIFIKNYQKMSSFEFLKIKNKIIHRKTDSVLSNGVNFVLYLENFVVFLIEQV